MSFKITGRLHFQPLPMPALASTAAPRVTADVTPVQPTEEQLAQRQAACEVCDYYGRLSDMALEFEISETDRQSEDQVCTHPNCGCWKNIKRAEPWRRLKRCPINAWK